MPQNSLDIGNDEKFEDYWHIIENVGFVAIALFVLAGMLGFLGGNTTMVAVPGLPINISYDRFTRYQGSSALTIRIEKPLLSDNLRINLGNELLEHSNVSSIMPRAASEKLSADGAEYNFTLAPDHLGTVTINLMSKKAGYSTINLSVEGQKLSLKQFTYP